MKNKVRLLALTTVLLWAIANVLIKVVIQYYSVESISFLRYLISAITLIIYGIYKKISLPKKEDIPYFIFGGILGFAGYAFAYNNGARFATASMISIIINTTPIITALFAQFFLKEKINKLGWFSISLSFSGVLIIALSGGSLDFENGVLWLGLAALMLSGYNIFQKKMLKKYSAIEITTYCITISAILLLMFAPHSLSQLVKADSLQLFSILFLGIFSTAVGYLCWSSALSKAKKTNDVINYMFFIPIISTFLGFVFLKELPHPSVFIGGAIILLSSVLVNIKKQQLTVVVK